MNKLRIVVRRLLLVWEVWGSNPEPIKSPIRCQRFATVAALMCGATKIWFWFEVIQDILLTNLKKFLQYVLCLERRCTNIR